MKMSWIGWAGIIIGILGGCIGMAAAIAADPIPGTLFSLFFIVIFGGTFFFAFKPLIDANQVMKNGKDATAKILEIRDTGITINNNPQINLLLEVYPADGTPSFQAKTRQLISRLQTSGYQEGQTLTVKYDPNHTSKVAIVAIGASNKYAEDPKLAEKELREIDKENRRIVSEGKPAKAIILEYTEMGINVNGDNPAVILQLEVLTEDRSIEPYKATAKGIVSQQSRHKYQPGKEIYVKYDRDDLSKVAVDHS